MTDTRKRRGASTQHIAARWFQEHGWPFAESTGAGRTGSDLTGMPGLACEIKARATFSPLAWIRQARSGGTGLPFVILRCNGQGEAAVGEWPVILRLEQFTTLLHAAGYGSPTGPPFTDEEYADLLADHHITNGPPEPDPF